MQATRRPLLMLVLLVFTSLSPLMNASSEHTDYDVQLHRNSMSESEKLALASSMWHITSPDEMVSVSLQASTGVLHLNIDSFDPVLDDHPSPGLGLYDANDFTTTGLAIVQLKSHDGSILNDLVERHGITPLDFIGDEGWLVRLSDPPADSIRALHADDDVRWVGAQHPGWRIESSLLTGHAYERLALVPAGDLALAGLELLSLDLVRMGATQSYCGVGVCEVQVPSSHRASFIANAASDGRLIWIEPTVEFSLHNALAAAASGVIDVRNSATFTLDGSGEMIAIADTGLDQDHPDLSGRVAAVNTQFGLDSSPADSNTGHGTHIAISALGSGQSNSSAAGIAPDADLVMYALEHDPTGVFGRVGSIYDLLRDAEQMTARVAINAWGANGNYGQYSADSRSVDILVHDKPDMLPLFSVGDRGAQGASQVTAPSTAKNVLAIGASGTGSTAGTVASFSSHGPSLDGRVKPDLVAPGVDLCSGRAEEAKTSPGLSCSSETHSSGTELYTSLSGTSQATAIAGGVAALTREFIREEVGVNAPSGSLVKAAMINGAADLGAADIPNAVEGWGQVDLARTVLPVWDASSPSTSALATFMDDNTPLDAGFGLLYGFDLDAAHGIDITLVWSDEAGSANAAQSQSRLVNNLDLVLVSPSGVEWFGNNFANGYTSSGQSADSTNNVERIKVAPGVLTESGQWLVKVMHRGGTTQDFGLVVTADATPTPQADIALYNGSIIPSSPEPLRNDLIAIRIGWINQGTLATTSFRVIFEDLTSGDTLFEGDRPALAAGTIDSLLIQHQFTTTGPHSMRLRVDTNNQVAEMNDGTSGIDNNIWEQDIEVTALGVRVVALNDDGTVPSTAQAREDAAIKIFDVRNQTGIDIPIHILHEGTGQKNVTLSVTGVEVPQPGRPDFLLSPADTWTKSVSELGPHTVQGQGEAGDFKLLTIHLEDEDADLTDSTNPRYARSGTFVVDVTARYQDNPTVAHTQRLTFIIEQLDEVLITPLGTEGLTAEPGDSAGFRISVANIGNSPAQYSISCTSEHRWQIMLKDTNSSTLEIEPIGIREYRAIKIDLFVPPVVGGNPLTGSTDTVTCYVTSGTDPSLNYSETATITVLPQQSFDADLYDDIGAIGPSSRSREVLVDSGEQVSMNLTVENTGNTDLDLSVKIQPSNPTWPIEVSIDAQKDARQVLLALGPGESATVYFVLGVPGVAEEGDANNFVIRTELTSQVFISNTTVLKVRDELALDLVGPEGNVIETVLGSTFSYGEFNVTNTGNAPLTLGWSNGLAPDGWVVGFANPITYLEPREEKSIRFGLIPPANAPATDVAFNLLITVSGGNNGRLVESSVRIDVAVLPSQFVNISVEDDTIRPFRSVAKGEGATQSIVIRNDGNLPVDASLAGDVLDAEGNTSEAWSVSFSKNQLSNLGVGESITVDITIIPKDPAKKGLMITEIRVMNADVPIGTLQIETTVSSVESNGGLFAVLPLYVSVPLLGVILAVGVVLALRMKRSGELEDDGSELVAPDAFVNPDHLGTRRDDALDIGHAVNEIASAEVSQDEIAAALAQSLNLPAAPATIPAGLPPRALPMGLPPAGLPPAGMPPKALPTLPMPAATLPLPMRSPMPAPVVAAPVPVAAPVTAGPPLPASGLPDGWTIEQWQHYGQQWLERNGQ
jgi:uncharacterized membrane protein